MKILTNEILEHGTKYCNEINLLEAILHIMHSTAELSQLSV